MIETEKLGLKQLKTEAVLPLAGCHQLAQACHNG